MIPNLDNWSQPLLALLALYEKKEWQDYILLGHCLWSAYAFKDTFHKSHWFLSFWMTYTMGFGGGIFTALFMGDNNEANQFILSYNMCGVLFAISWWSVNHFPFDLVAKVYSLLPIRMCGTSCLNILRAGILVARIDQCARLYPGVVIAPLILGTMGASAGGLATDPVLRSVYPEQKELKRSDWAAPAFGLWSGLLGSLAYVSAVYWYPLVTPPEGKAIVVTFFVAHGLWCEVVGFVDWTRPFARLLLASANIPDPNAGPRAKKAPSGALKAAQKGKKSN